MIGKSMDLSELLYNPNALPQVQLNTGAQLGYGGLRAPQVAAPVNMPVEQMAQQPMPQRTPAGELERDRALAEMLMQADSSPVYSSLQGLARVGEKIAGALIAKDANKKERANSAADREELARLLSGGGSPSAGAGGSSPTSAPNTDWAMIAATSQSPQVKAYAENQLKQQQWQQQKDYEARLKREEAVFEDNAGNRWRMGANGQPEMIFYDRNLRMDSNVTTDPITGQQILTRSPIPNAYNPDGTPSMGAPMQGAPQVGAVVADPRKAGASSDVMKLGEDAAMAGIDNGGVLTREQERAIRAALGSGADSYMRAHNMRVQ